MDEISDQVDDTSPTDRIPFPAAGFPEPTPAAPGNSARAYSRRPSIRILRLPSNSSIPAHAGTQVPTADPEDEARPTTRRRSNSEPQRVHLTVTPGASAQRPAGDVHLSPLVEEV